MTTTTKKPKPVTPKKKPTGPDKNVLDKKEFPKRGSQKDGGKVFPGSF